MSSLMMAHPIPLFHIARMRSTTSHVSITSFQDRHRGNSLRHPFSSRPLSPVVALPATFRFCPRKGERSSAGRPVPAPAAASAAAIKESTSFTHKIQTSSESKIKDYQGKLLGFIKENPGLQSRDGLTHGQRGGFAARELVLLPAIESTDQDEETPDPRQESWPLEWSDVTVPGVQGLAIGSMPSSAGEIQSVLDDGAFDAVVALMHPSEVVALGIDIADLGEAVEAKDRLMLQCPVIEGIPAGFREGPAGIGAVDVGQLKEALRVVTALLRTGQRTLLCCTCGTYSSALVALCYLTFVQGMPLRTGLSLLKASIPGAAPPLMFWDEARSAWSTLEDSSRLAQLAEEAKQERESQAKPGNAMDDWMAARQALIVEMLNDQADADVALAKAVTRTGSGNGRMAAAQANGTPPPTVEDRLMLERAMAAAAPGAWAEAEELRLALDQQSAETRRLSAELAAAERQLVEAQVAVRKAGRAEQVGDAIPGASNEIQAFLAESALSAALRQELEAKAKIETLEEELRSASRAQVASSEKLQFLEREAVRLRAKEEASRKVASTAIKDSKNLAAKLERTEAARAVVAKQADELLLEVSQLREQSKRAEETEQELQALQTEVASLNSELKTAKDEAIAATSRSEFLMRQATELRQKVEEGTAAQKAASAESASTIAQLKAELREAQERALKAEKERDRALEQVSSLKEQLEETQKKLKEASQKLVDAEGRIAFLLRKVDATQVKQKAAEGALSVAKDQVKRMARNVDVMRRKLFSSTSKTSGSAAAAEKLIATAEELYSRLEAHAKRLQASVAASDGAASHLEIKTKAAQGSALESRGPVPSLAEAVPGILAAAEDNAAKAALTSQQEELLKDVTCLREAVEVLDGQAVGLFSDLVKGTDKKPDAVKAPLPSGRSDPWR